MKKKAIVTVVVAIIVYRLLKKHDQMDFDKHVINHQPGPCQFVKGIDIGAADIEELPNGQLLITSGLLFNSNDKSSPVFQNRKGSVKLFDFAHPEKAETLKLEYGEDFDPDTFNPHGLSTWADAKTVYVFIVNHLPEGNEVVERFQFVEKHRALKHLDTIQTTGYFHYLNDLVAVGPRSFYFTNFQYFVNQPYAHLEMVLGPRWGSVGFYDGDMGSKLVYTGMNTAAGINKSPDGNFIYVAHIGGKDVLVFRRESDDYLTLMQSFPVHTMPDHIYVSQDGQSIWSGAHPILWQILEHSRDGVSRAPSQVLHLTLEAGLIKRVREIFADDGELLSGASSSVYRDGYVIIGTINNEALFCQVKHVCMRDEY